MKTQVQHIKDFASIKLCQCFTWSFWVESDEYMIWSVGPVPTYKSEFSKAEMVS